MKYYSLTFILILYFSKFFFENTYNLDVYPIITLLLVGLILNFVFSGSIHFYLIIYTFLITVSFLITTLYMTRLNSNFSNMIFLYIIQPIALIGIYNSLQIKNSENLSENVLRFFSYTSIIPFLGGLYFFAVHALGFPDPYNVFEIQFARAGAQVVWRNVSFFGSALVFCGVALIQFLSSEYLNQIYKSNIFKLYSFFAVLSIFMSLSRRAILPILIFYFIKFLYSKLDKKILGLLIFLCFIIFIASLFPEIFLIIFERTYLMFDINSDSSNVSRITLMLNGIYSIFEEPIGLGFGSLSSIGYSDQQVKESAEVIVTESSIITIFGELGLLTGIVLSLILFKYLSILRLKIILLFMLPILIESVVGLGILSPVVSFMTILFVLSLYRLEMKNYLSRRNGF